MSGSADQNPGSADNKSGSANDQPVSANNKPGSNLEPWRQSREHPESLYSSLGTTTSSLGMLLVGPEIITTTYYSTIFKTHVFSWYSHLCMYKANHLHTVYLDLLKSVLERNLRCA